MGLTQKILLFTAALIVALVGTSLVFTTVQADRLARAAIHQGLLEAREIWETYQADRYNKLKLGVRVLANEPPFKAALSERHHATSLDSLQERGQDMNADFMLATDDEGLVVARTDRPSEQGEDLSEDPLIQSPLDGEEAATVWKLGGTLYNAVAVPMQTGPEFHGVLVAGYAIDDAVANQIRRVTRSEIAFLTSAPGHPAEVAVTSLGRREAGLKAALGAPAFAARAPGDTQPFELDLAGERYIGVEAALRAASGEDVGSVLALRSLAEEMADHRQFRNSLILVSLVVMAVGLGLAYVAATRITGPVRSLVSLVERVRDGSYSGAVHVATRDEVGVLARAFNNLLADLREKEQMIEFLREGMTLLKKAATTGVGAPAAEASATTALPVSASAATGVLERGALFAARYEVLATVGKGGMGVVYRARDRQLDEVVALKVLRGEVLRDDPTILQRFKEEVKLARRITHRNVLRTHDFGEADGTSYISMEYLEGVTLKELVRGRGALPVPVGLSISKQMCLGLEAAHEQGVVHRDIKPQNMLILPETGELKIMDFGIARVSEVKRDAGLTTAGTVMGTPDYMPPEQAQGLAADFRSDIYSLGVVLFETFTGALPFGGDTVMAVVMGHIQRPPPPPRSLNAGLPAALEALILRCMEKTPERRFQRVEQVLDGLSAISAREAA